MGKNKLIKKIYNPSIFTFSSTNIHLFVFE